MAIFDEKEYFCLQMLGLIHKWDWEELVTNYRKKRIRTKEMVCMTGGTYEVGNQESDFGRWWCALFVLPTLGF